MSAKLQQAIGFYKSGNYAMAMSQLGPIARAMKVPDPSVALMMAQSCYRLGQLNEAAFWYDKACLPGIQNRAQIQLLAANLYSRARNWKRACDITRDILEQDPGADEALALHRCALRALLMFDEMEASNRALRTRQMMAEPAALALERPLDNVFWSANEALAARLTRIDGGKPFTATSRAKRRAHPHVFGKKIRIAYLSSDFSDRHATMHLLRGVFFAHDPDRFDITLICHTDEPLRMADQGLRSHLPIASIGNLPDEDVVQQIRDSEIDILVDLKGHTKDPRLNIFNLGAAPIQVAWLGFPGITTGIDVDYVIGDPVVTPPSSAPFWDTNFCRLPETYQPNDDRFRVLPPATSRAALGLPEDKVIFASFNSVLKISPETFHLWMEILKQAPDSLLWMMCELPEARENFLAAAAKAGVGPERIVFAGHADYPAHIARLQAADLGIDTFPCNGHTTTSDKLWAGLPLVTRKGSSFASRVSESLLRALDMADLVTGSDRDYVALNVRLATDNALRTSMRERVSDNRFRAPLFDTKRFTRHLEMAFTLMVERAKEGLPPEAIDVPALPRSTEPFR